jgi:polyphosphate kinase
MNDMKYQFFDRDLSWLSFNQRVLSEAGRPQLPLVERLRFLAIYSSNLDEFYRVRIPALMALHKITGGEAELALLDQVRVVIEDQQACFGKILGEVILPELEKNGVALCYDQPLPPSAISRVRKYFLTEVAAFTERVYPGESTTFFPQSNRIYFLVSLSGPGPRRAIVNIPSEALPRFLRIAEGDGARVIFLDDIIRENLDRVFPGRQVTGCWSFKITRDAELNLQDEYEGDIAERIERQIAKRDQGLATRVLYDQCMAPEELTYLIRTLGLKNANVVKGGRYHNLRDLAEFPARHAEWCYTPWKPLDYPVGESVFSRMEQGDFMIHPPYQNYDTVLRFFNEAALDEDVTDIYITLYRVASDSRIAHALISAARNGKKVLVFVELLARFDEANNLRWAKRMKAAGIRLIYSIPGMKVHAKMALIKRKTAARKVYYGLLSTGNLNETTARFYTDHILFTASRGILREMELLFLFLKKREKPGKKPKRLHFEHLLVAQFNLADKLTELIRFEVNQARRGGEAAITLKLNNLEEETLISELYRASRAGVRVRLIIRGICRLVPGVEGMSEHITVRRIVDRYLEHGRVCIFHHGGNQRVIMGSADWMERNIFRRIEVCFPVYDAEVQGQVTSMIDLELKDNVQAVTVDEALRNVAVPVTGKKIASQYAIYQSLTAHE